MMFLPMTIGEFAECCWIVRMWVFSNLDQTARGTNVRKILPLD